MTASATTGRPVEHPAAHAPPRHVVCLMDGYDRSLPALREAVRIAQAEGAGLTVVYEEATARYLVSLEGGVWLANTEEIERCARGLVEREVRAVPDTGVEVCWGGGAHVACEIAREREPSVIVVPSCERRITRILRGDAARRLARHAPCAVLPVAV